MQPPHDPLEAPVEEAIERFIVGAPYGQWLGLACESIERDHVRVVLPFRKEVTTFGEMVHGGAIASLVDVTATAAAWAHPAVTLQARGTTVGFSLSFLAPGLGSDLIADAVIIRRGGSLCVCEVTVSSPGGECVARALVTYKLKLPPPPGAAA